MKPDDMTLDELLNQSEMKDFLFRAEREMFPKMKGSVVSLVIGCDHPDAKLALEIGAAILFDKPIILLIKQGRTVSASLRRIAHEVVELPEDLQSPEAQAKIQAALKRLIPGGPA